jgi:hypothetical protein
MPRPGGDDQIIIRNLSVSADHPLVGNVHPINVRQHDLQVISVL